MVKRAIDHAGLQSDSSPHTTNTLHAKYLRAQQGTKMWQHDKNFNLHRPDVKLCTYHHWFGRPGNLQFVPYYDLPMGTSKLRALVQFRLGSHTLPIEQGCFARPAVPPPSPVHRLRYTGCGR